MNDRYKRAPHQLESDRTGHSPNAALFIDFDNVTMGVRSNLGQELRNLLDSDIIRGKVAIQRAYADWRRYPQYVVPLSEASIDLIYAPAYGSSKKNATDIRLAIDALEVVFTRPEIGTYILLSGDSDFSSLVLKLKEYGKYVIGVGMQESSSELLVQNCDEYYSYDTLSGLVSADDVKTEKHDPWELVEQAVQKMDSRNDVMRSDRLKQVMLELDSSFDEKEIGFSKFNRFLTEASSRGILELHRIGNGQYEVAPTDASREEPPPSRAESRTGSRSEGRGNGGRGRRKSGRGGGRARPAPPEPIAEADSLKEAYELLQDVVAELADPDTPVRDSEVKRRILERESDFDEATLGFSKFSRFLSQAHDEGVITLIKGDEGNYYLQTTDEGASTEAPSAEPAPAGRAEENVAAEAREPERRPEPTAREETAVETEPEPEPGAEPEEEARPAAREPERPRRSVTGRRGRRGGRRGASSGSGKGSGDEAVVPGPAGDGGESDRAAEPAAAGAGRSEPEEESRDEAAASGATSSRPAGLGRFRRGRRGGRRGDAGSGAEKPALGNVAGSASPASPVPESGSEDGGTAGRGEPSRDDWDDGDGPAGRDAAAGERSADDLVAHMAENYPGVGERTAQALVEEFGARTLDVIDREPGRIKELLPRHRADAVLDARAEERGGSAE